MQREGLLERARHVGGLLGKRLREFESHPAVTEVRGDVAVRAVGLAEGYRASWIREHMLSNGVIARPVGESTISFCPPLVISDGELDEAVDALGAALDDAPAS